MRPQSTCSIAGCGNQAHARGWCHKHYRRWRKYGDTSVTYAIHGDLPIRFWAKVGDLTTDGCWEWSGTRATTGYGVLRREPGGNYVGAHVISYELHYGPIPRGMHIDHLCRNRWCVNPSHLEVVTPTENMLRGEAIPAQNARKTHCKRGHEFTPENTYSPPGRPGGRLCRECQRQKSRAWKESRRLRGLPPGDDRPAAVRGFATPGQVLGTPERELVTVGAEDDDVPFD